MTARFTDHILGPGTHAARPSAASTPDGALYECTDHNQIDRNNAGTWGLWAALGGSFVDPLTTKGDLLARTASASARVGVGANGTVLQADSSATPGVKWDLPPEQVLYDAKGDILIGSANDARGKLSVGADGQVLTADSSQPLGVKWAAGGGGGGGATSPFALDPASLHATYGDHFTGASLTATRAWNRQGFTSSNELFQKGANTWFQNDTSGVGSNAYYWQTAPAGDFTLVMSAILYGNSAMFGPMILDSSGNGVSCGVYSGPEAHYVLSCSAGAYSGTNANFQTTTTPYVWSGAPVWYKLNKTGTNYKASISTNGQVWRPWTSTISFGTTPTRIGFGNILGTVNGFGIDFFDVQ